MLKALLKKQLLELFQGYFIDRKTGKARAKTGTILYFALFAFVAVALGFTFFGVAGGLGSAILNNGMNWLYFSIMGLLSMALGVFGSVFNTYTALYLPKDNELLLSMPIPIHTLILSRIAEVYITSLLYGSWVWIPTVIAYYTLAPLNALNVIFPILLTFLIAAFITVLSCILGFFVALISKKTKGKSIVSVIISIAFIAIYYFVYIKIANSFSTIISNIDKIGNTVRSYLHYIFILGKSADGDALSMLIFSLITVALVLVCFFVLTKTFTKLATSTSNLKNKTAKIANYERKSVKSALVNREYKHFTSVSIWMLNGGLGLLIFVVGAVAAVIKYKALGGFTLAIAKEVPELYAALPIIFAFATCLIISTDQLFPAMISIEGKSLWILSSLPIDPKDILRAKEKMGIELTFFPAILFAVTVGTVLGFSVYEIVLICLIVCAFLALNADFGLFLNLKMPNFSWISEITVVKQGMPVTINLFGSWLFCALFGLAGFFLSDYVNTIIILSGFFVILTVMFLILHRYIMTKGAKIFAEL